ncbi:MAG TPA: GFA family protein [Pseudolabrys sp.]
MKVDGRCHCGYIRYEAEIDPDTVAICNCTDCQTLSGSAFRTVVPTKKGSFKLLQGELKIYVKTGESGNKRPQSFCPHCGSPIYSTSTEPGLKVHSIRVGTLNQRDQLAPKLQYWHRSAQRWTSGIGALPVLEKQRQ